LDVERKVQAKFSDKCVHLSTLGKSLARSFAAAAERASERTRGELKKMKSRRRRKLKAALTTAAVAERHAKNNLLIYAVRLSLSWLSYSLSHASKICRHISVRFN
jgi:hypothetical protein